MANRAAVAPVASSEVLAASEHPAVVQKVNWLMADVVRKRASDLFFEPEGDSVRVRVRIDGFMHPVTVIPKHQKDAVLTRVKVVSGVAKGK